MYKLVAVDLDGTMLNSFGDITENTKQVIKEKIKDGKEIIIASGRSIDSIKTIAEEIGSENFFIAGNGSIIYDIQKDKIIYEKYIPKNKALQIMEMCEENSIFYTVYTKNTIVTSSLQYNVLYYYKENLKKEENKKTSITIVENICEYVKNMRDEKVMKILVADNTKSIFNSIIKKVRNIKDVEVLDVSHMSRKIIRHGTEEIPIEYYYTEISMQNVDKWSAIEYLIKRIEIKKEEVIAIGDNMNDKKMIENAGLGIAMKGSMPEVLEAANYVTSSNNEEGVASALQKFL